MAGYGCANAYPAVYETESISYLDRKEAALSEEKQERKRKWRSPARPKHLMVRLTLEEHDEITRRAKLARKSGAGFLIYCGLKNKLPPMRKALPVGEEIRVEVERILREMRKVGVNLNSLQHAYNRARVTGDAPPAREEFERAIIEIGEVIGELVVVLKERL
jgi:hypothetical protein